MKGLDDLPFLITMVPSSLLWSKSSYQRENGIAGVILGEEKRSSATSNFQEKVEWEKQEVRVFHSSIESLKFKQSPFWLTSKQWTFKAIHIKYLRIFCQGLWPSFTWLLQPTSKHMVIMWKSYLFLKKKLEKVASNNWLKIFASPISVNTPFSISNPTPQSYPTINSEGWPDRS